MTTCESAPLYIERREKEGDRMADKKEKSAGQTPEAPKPQSTESQAPQYMKEALLLANSYTQMLAERDRLKKRLAGSWVYTKTMAIEELDSITVSYEGERVQSSNISNPTERIALKLTDAYMAKKQAEMDAAKAACERDLEYVNWKIEVVETVMNERMKDLQKPVFVLLYINHSTFRDTEKAIRKKYKRQLYNRNLTAIKEQIWDAFIQDLMFRSKLLEQEEYMDRLSEETLEV